MALDGYISGVGDGSGEVVRAVARRMPCHDRVALG